MKSKMILASLMAVAAMVSAAHAESRRGPGHGMPPGVEKTKWDAMSSEERKAFHQERKAKWDAMSDTEKVKMIEEHRAKRMKKMDAQWDSMGDAEKVKFVEDRMNARKSASPAQTLGFQQ